MDLLNITMNDGSRQFLSLPQSIDFVDVHRRLKKRRGIRFTRFLVNPAGLVWMDFDFRNHHFSLTCQRNHFWFFVTDPVCPDDILLELSSHCASFLSDQPSAEHAPANLRASRQDLFVYHVRELPTLKESLVELCCGPARWLFSILALMTAGASVWLYFDTPSLFLIMFPLFLFFASLATVNWAYHLKGKRHITLP
jgi:hypothetical protein